MITDKSQDSVWSQVHRSAEKPPIRVAVVEDDRITRNLLLAVIEKAPSLLLLKAYADGESAMMELGGLAPQVVIMDIQLPKRSGIDCTRVLKQQFPEIQIIMFTVFSDSEHVMEALKAGASGYLLKRASAEEMVRSIEHVWEGGAPMSPGIARMIVEALHTPGGGAGEDKRELWQLTQREHEILQLLAKGYSAKELGSHLNISEPTIRFHLRNIYSKLHVRSRTEAVVKYLK